MATTTTTNYTLAIGFEGLDAVTGRTKTTYLKLPNPKENVTENEIRTAAASVLKILNDSNGDAYDTATAIATAYTETQEIIDVDTGYTD